MPPFFAVLRVRGSWRTLPVTRQTRLALADVINATQMLDAWTGAVASAMTLQGARPEQSATDARVSSAVHPTVDALAVRLELSSHMELLSPQQK